MLDEPFVDSRGGPSFVDGSGSLEVGDLDVVQECSSTSWGRSRDDVVLLEPCSELVVVPSGEDVVLGVIELLCGLCRSVGSLRGESLVTG